jgi:hypothetical protein
MVFNQCRAREGPGFFYARLSISFTTFLACQPELVEGVDNKLNILDFDRLSLTIFE